MAILWKILLIPYFLLWIINEKVPLGGEEIFVSFIYDYFAALLILSLLISRNLGLHRSSFLAVALIYLLIPTLFYQITGLTDAVPFDHLSRFPTGPILKLSLIALVFVAINELLIRRYVTVDFIFKGFLIAVLISIPKYLVESYELLLYLDVYGNRPYPEWIGGWNTYSFVLSLAFVVLLGPLRLLPIVRYSLLTLILAVMLTTLSRGGFLALVVALFLYFRSSFNLVKGHERVRAIFRVGAVIALGVGAIMVAVVVTGVGDALYSRFVESFLETQHGGDDYLQSVSSGRTVFWLDTLSRFTNVEHIYQWFFGYGIGHFAILNDHGFWETEMASQYIYFVYEYGLIVGLGLAVLMFRAYTLIRWRSNYPWARVVKTMFVIYLVLNFVEEFIYTTQVGWLIGVGAAIVLHALRNDRMGLPRLTGFGHGPAINGSFAMKA